MTDSVVLVHGLWMNGMDMGVLRRRLQRSGFEVVQFRYQSLRNSPLTNAAELHRFADGLKSESVHFVAHSLGGLVLRHLFFEYPEQRPGRVVTLGTPHASSAAARTLSGWPGGRMVLGQSLERGLLGNVPPWQAQRELGSIAGTLRLGLGMIVPDIPSPNDGTVAVEETRIAGMRDHLALPVSHFGRLLSGEVARQTERFLRSGKFSKPNSR